MTNKYNITGKAIMLKRFADVEKDTIPAIRRIIYQNYPAVQQLAYSLKAITDQQTFQNIWNWVRQNIHYKNDEEGKEQLRRPQRTIYEATGDCDDMSILISSILINLGYKHELIIAAYKKPDQWQHIYPVAYSHSGQRYVIDCVPEIPYFNYEAKPIINQIQINMKLEELGAYEGGQSSSSDMFEELITPVTQSDFAGLGEYVSEEEELLMLQGALGNVALVDEDDDYDTMLSGSELEKNIYLKQLVEARLALIKELSNPSEMSQVNDTQKELKIVENIIDNFYDDNERDYALKTAISQNTLYKNFYISLQYGLENTLKGLNGDEFNDEYYLKIMEDANLSDELMQGISGDLGKLKLFKKIKAKVQAFKEKHPKIAKVMNKVAKFSPATFGIRRSVEAFIRSNTFQVAEKLAIGYATEAEAQKLGYSTAEWKQFVDTKDKAEAKWFSVGGDKAHFRKMVVEGRGGKKAGISGQLGVAPAIIAAVAKLFGVVMDMIKNLKMKKQAREAEKSAANNTAQNKSAAIPTNNTASNSGDDYSDDGGDGSGDDTTTENNINPANDPNTEVHAKSGVITQKVTDENGKEKTIYKDKDGKEINRFKAFFLKHKMWIIIISCIIVVGIIALIIWKVRKRKRLSGLGSADNAGLTVKQANYIRRQGLNNKAYGALVREEISKDGKQYNSTNRKKYYKKVFKEAFTRSISPKQAEAARRFNEMYKRVREKAKAYGGGSRGWLKAWSEEKKSKGGIRGIFGLRRSLGRSKGGSRTNKLNQITQRARQIRKRHPKKKWQNCIKQASRELQG